MKPQPKTNEHFYCSQFNWKHENQGAGAIAKATEQILNGQTVAFDCYKRGETSTDMIFQVRHWIGQRIIEDGLCLRTNTNNDTDTSGSHSLIATWYGNKIVTDPATIAATIAIFFKPYTDFFLVEQEEVICH